MSRTLLVILHQNLTANKTFSGLDSCRKNPDMRKILKNSTKLLPTSANFLLILIIKVFSRSGNMTNFKILSKKSCACCVPVLYYDSQGPDAFKFWNSVFFFFLNIWNFICQFLFFLYHGVIFKKKKIYKILNISTFYNSIPKSKPDNATWQSLEFFTLLDVSLIFLN